MKNPYDIIKKRYTTEKSSVLERLQTSESNRSLSRCKTPKYVFVVDSQANKLQIASAIEEIYKEKKIKVVGVNTIRVKEKPKRRGRGRPGAKASFKKAIVTLEAGDIIENV